MKLKIFREFLWKGHGAQVSDGKNQSWVSRFLVHWLSGAGNSCLQNISGFVIFHALDTILASKCFYDSRCCHNSHKKNTEMLRSGSLYWGGREISPLGPDRKVSVKIWTVVLFTTPLTILVSKIAMFLFLISLAVNTTAPTSKIFLQFLRPPSLSLFCNIA